MDPNLPTPTLLHVPYDANHLVVLQQAADALVFRIGDLTDDFPDVMAITDWLQKFAEFATGTAQLPPVILVLALPGTAPEKLVDDYGAVFLDRHFWTIPDLIKWVASFVVAPVPTASGAGMTSRSRTIEPPPAEAAMFGRQPSHAEPFDPQQFEQTMQGLNAFPWWALDS